MGASHEPVLKDEVIELLEPRAGGRYLDLTLGAGGYARALLEASAPDGRLVGVDRDPAALTLARAALAPFAERATLLHGDFRDVADHVARLGLGPFDGVVADLGVSSMQLDTPERGFSFSSDGPLDMRMSPDSDLDARRLLDRLDEHELARVLRELGEERLARRIARAIVRRRPITRTAELADIARAAYTRAGLRSRIDPATRTFQAIRLAVNDELGALEALLASFEALLAPRGVAAVVSFHSLEDRMVKHRFRELARRCVCPPELPRCACGGRARVELLTRRAIQPSPAEQERNPRSRSARLRAVRSLAEAA